MPGGFSIAFGVEKVPGQRAAPEDMRSLGGSAFGSEPLRDNLHALLDALFPAAGDGEEDGFAIMRAIATAAATEGENIEELHDTIRYRLAQPEVPLQTPFARVMSSHNRRDSRAKLLFLLA